MSIYLANFQDVSWEKYFSAYISSFGKGNSDEKFYGF